MHVEDHAREQLRAHVIQQCLLLLTILIVEHLVLEGDDTPPLRLAHRFAQLAANCVRRLLKVVLVLATAEYLLRLLQPEEVAHKFARARRVCLHVRPPLRGRPILQAVDRLRVLAHKEKLLHGLHVLLHMCEVVKHVLD